MLFFYIVTGVLFFAVAGVLMHTNRLATYRRRIIRELAKDTEQKPFVLSEAQEKKIKQCFLNSVSREDCIKQL